MTHNGTAYTAEIVGFESDNDVAVLKIDAEGLKAVQLAQIAHCELMGDRMAVLARCSGERLSALWATLGLQPRHTPLRGPEAGLVMLRGRVGGTGEP